MGRSKQIAVHGDALDNFLGNDGIIRTSEQIITENVTIDSDVNAMSIGPITVDSSVTITINGNYTVV